MRVHVLLDGNGLDGSHAVALDTGKRRCLSQRCQDTSVARIRLGAVGAATAVLRQAGKDSVFSLMGDKRAWKKGVCELDTGETRRNNRCRE